MPFPSSYLSLSPWLEVATSWGRQVVLEWLLGHPGLSRVASALATLLAWPRQVLQLGPPSLPVYPPLPMPAYAGLAGNMGREQGKASSPLSPTVPPQFPLQDWDI